MSKKLIDYSIDRKLTLIFVAIEKYTSPFKKLWGQIMFIYAIRKFYWTIDWLNQFSYQKDSDSDHNKLMLSSYLTFKTSVHNSNIVEPSLRGIVNLLYIGVTRP